MLQVGRPNSMTVTRQSEEVGVAFGILGCPCLEVRINGDRINGLFHLGIDG